MLFNYIHYEKDDRVWNGKSLMFWCQHTSVQKNLIKTLIEINLLSQILKTSHNFPRNKIECNFLEPLPLPNGF